MAVRNRFLILLKTREIAENRRIFYREVSDATGIALNTIVAWAKNEMQRFDAPIIEGLCKYFKCTVGDLLYIEENSETEGTEQG